VKKGKKRIKKKTSHGLTRNLTEGRIDGRTGLSICHGISRINTEGHGRKIRQKKRLSICHGLTRNLTERRIDGRTGLSICHGRTRNFTEGRIQVRIEGRTG